MIFRGIFQFYEKNTTQTNHVTYIALLAGISKMFQFIFSRCARRGARYFVVLLESCLSTCLEKNVDSIY